MSAGVEEFEVRIPLPPGRGAPVGRARDYGRSLADSMAELHASIMVLGSLDPVTTELVRLRCARWHDCRVCSSLRLDSALTAMGDQADDLSDKVIDYEASDLSDRHKLALRLTEAFTTEPGAIDAELRDALLDAFSKEEVVEILLDIVAWTQQKALVALRLDLPMDQTTRLAFDDDGHVKIGAPL